MIKKVIGATALLIVGYIVGVNAGFKVALRDYVENDAKLLDKIEAKQSNDEEKVPDKIKGIVEDAREADDGSGQAFY